MPDPELNFAFDWAAETTAAVRAWGSGRAESRDSDQAAAVKAYAPAFAAAAWTTMQLSRN